MTELTIGLLAGGISVMAGCAIGIVLAFREHRKKMDEIYKEFRKHNQ